MFHLMTHAFFKALLFLGAGAVILAMHHEQDTDKMGGLRRRIRRTHGVFLIGVIAIAGFPPFSGFFSKDEILLAAYVSHVPGHAWLYGIGLGTALLTAFYMFRLHFRTFFGACRAPADVRDQIREPGAWVLQPLYVLAGLSIVGGLAGLSQAYGDVLAIERSNSFANFLAPVIRAEPHDVSHALELRLAGRAVLAAALGLAAAWWLYVYRPGLPARIRGALPALYRLVEARYRVDELYDAAIVRPTVWLSDRVLFRAIDAGLVDGVAVNGSARTVQALAGRALKYAQSGLAQGYLFLMFIGAVVIVGYLIR
jgi:NADH-quinone oxidoreductase subunit L